MLIGERYLAEAQKKLFKGGYFGNEQAAKDETEARKKLAAYSQKIDQQYANEEWKRNINGSVLNAIEKGQWNLVPEAVLKTVADAALQIFPTMATGGYSMYAQTLPDTYLAGVKEVAEKTGRTVDQVIEDGDDGMIVANISAGLQAALEKVSGGIFSKTLATKGGYKSLRDFLIKKGMKRLPASGVALGSQMGKETGIEVLQEGIGIGGEQLTASNDWNEYKENLYNELQTPEAQKRLKESAVGGFVGAGGLIGGGRFYQSWNNGTLLNTPVTGKTDQKGDFNAVISADAIESRTILLRQKLAEIKANPQNANQIAAKYDAEINKIKLPSFDQATEAYLHLTDRIGEGGPQNAYQAQALQSLENYIKNKGISEKTEDTGEKPIFNPMSRTASQEPLPTSLGGIQTQPVPQNAPAFVPEAPVVATTETPVAPVATPEAPVVEFVTVTDDELNAFQTDPNFAENNPERVAGVQEDADAVRNGEMTLEEIEDPNYRTMVQMQLEANKQQPTDLSALEAKLDQLKERFLNNGKTDAEADQLALNSITDQERQALRDAYNQERNQQQAPAAPQQVTIDQFSNPDEFYRVVVGDEAFNDIVQNGVVRTNADNKGNQTGGIDLGNRPTAFPSFSRGSASMEYAAANPNNYIIVSSDQSIQPSTKGRHGKGSTMFPTDENGNPMRELDGKKVKVYKHIGNGQYQLVYENGQVVNQQANDNTNAGTSQSVVDEGVGQRTGSENVVTDAGVVPAPTGSGTGPVLTEQSVAVPLPQVEQTQQAQVAPAPVTLDTKNIQVNGITLGNERIFGDEGVGDIREELPYEENSGNLIVTGKDGNKYVVAFSRVGGDGSNIFEKRGKDFGRPGQINVAVKISENATEQEIAAATAQAEGALQVILPTIKDNFIDPRAIRDVLSAGPIQLQSNAPAQQGDAEVEVEPTPTDQATAAQQIAREFLNIDRLVAKGFVNYVDDKTGKPCAKFGMRDNAFSRGSKWEIVKDLKGYATHEKGGVDLTIDNKGVRIGGADSKLYAADGLLMPNNGEPIPVEKKQQLAELERQKFIEYMNHPSYKERLKKEVFYDTFDPNNKKHNQMLENEYARRMKEISNIPISQGNFSEVKESEMPYAQYFSDMSSYNGLPGGRRGQFSKKGMPQIIVSQDAANNEININPNLYSQVVGHELGHSSHSGLLGGRAYYEGGVPAEGMVERTLQAHSESPLMEQKNAVRDLMRPDWDMASKKEKERIIQLATQKIGPEKVKQILDAQAKMNAEYYALKKEKGQKYAKEHGPNWHNQEFGEIQNNYIMDHLDQNATEVATRMIGLRRLAADKFGHDMNEDFDIKKYKDQLQEYFKKNNMIDEYKQLNKTLELSDDQINEMMKYIAKNNNNKNGEVYG